VAFFTPINCIIFFLKFNTPEYYRIEYGLTMKITTIGWWGAYPSANEATSGYLLESEGILQQRVYGRIRMYKFNNGSPKARAVQNLIETWSRINKS